MMTLKRLQMFPWSQFPSLEQHHPPQYLTWFLDLTFLSLLSPVFFAVQCGTTTKATILVGAWLFVAHTSDDFRFLTWIRLKLGYRVLIGPACHLRIRTPGCYTKQAEIDSVSLVFDLASLGVHDSNCFLPWLSFKKIENDFCSADNWMFDFFTLSEIKQQEKEFRFSKSAPHR